MNKFILNEDDENPINDIHIYQDGDRYYAYNGEKLIEVTKDNINKAIEEIEERNRYEETKDNPIETDDEYWDRVGKFQDALLNDNDIENEIKDVKEIQHKQHLRDEKRDYEKKHPNIVANQTVLSQLKKSITTFMEDQLEETRYDDYFYGESPYSLNKDEAGEIVVSRYEDEAVTPVVDIFLDRSNSWHVKWKIDIGDTVISAFRQFEKNDQIVLNIYDFSDDVFPHIDNPPVQGSGYWGGTDAWKRIKSQLLKDRPNNIAIVTDADIYGWTDGNSGGTYVADGAVWAVFVGAMPPDGLSSYITCKKNGNRKQFFFKTPERG